MVGVCKKIPVADAVRPKGLGSGGGPLGSVSQLAFLISGRSASISFHTKNAMVAVRNSKPRGSLKKSSESKNPSDATASDGFDEHLVTAKQSSPRRHLVPIPVNRSACELQQRAGCKSNFNDSHN